MKRTENKKNTKKSKSIKAGIAMMACLFGAFSMASCSGEGLEASEASSVVGSGSKATLGDVYRLYKANGGGSSYDDWASSEGDGSQDSQDSQGQTQRQAAPSEDTPVYIRVYGTLLQWSYDGSSWNDLFDLSSLEGEDGIDGKDGKDGADGKDGQDGVDGKDGVGISGVCYNGEGELLVEYDDGRIDNLGKADQVEHKHEYGCVEEPATCTKDGSYTFTCESCGHIEVVVSKAQGHVYGAWREIIPADCSGEGVRARVCSVCGERETETYAGCGHDLGGGWSYDSAKHWKECSLCGVAEEEGDHSYEDGYCPVCGMEKPESAGWAGLVFAKDADGLGYSVVDYGDCDGETAVIPDEYMGLPVTSIGASAFRGDEALRTVSIPGSVKRIGAYAFDGCEGLGSVSIPGSVAAIGDYAFRGCCGLESLSIGDGVASIGTGAFFSCSGIGRINLPDSVREIGSYAFDYCSGAAGVRLSSGLSRISDCAFGGCLALKSVSVPEGVVSIGGGAFHDCAAMGTAKLPESLKGIGRGAFEGCNSLNEAFFGGCEGWKQGGEDVCKEIVSNPASAARYLVRSAESWQRQ